ncbi:MAG: ROK family protein [Akkermansiaceae bacterium]|nr:ROK family protein [Akkermansiaceae bacterium]NNM28006.1 ROK family protein [Akkermansiaceae bacterium]
MSKLGIGIDLGGTAIKAAAFDLGTGALLHRATAPTRDGEEEDGRPAFAAEIRKLVRGLEDEAGTPAGVVGVSSPGLANREATAVVDMPGRLGGLVGLDWPGLLEKPAAVLNDAHAALLGEVWQGAAEGKKDVILLTLGTGVGGAVVADGKLLRGHFGKAGHLGHIALDFTGPPDICGVPGSLEDMIGNHNVAERSGGKFASTRELVEAVAAGDAVARETWDRSIRALAAGVASCVHVLDPELVLIGGGISQAWEHIEPGLKRHLDDFEWRPAGGRVEIRRAALGEWAGTYGAAWFAANA